MGNTPNKEAAEREYLNNYLNSQKNIIQQQQQQINELSKMSLNQQKFSTQNMTANMYFQQQQKQKQRHINNNINKNDYNSNNNKPNDNKLRITGKPKLNPYKVLGIDKNFDETTLKKAYLRMAMKTHPDKGGSEEQFQLVSLTQ